MLSLRVWKPSGLRWLSTTAENLRSFKERRYRFGREVTLYDEDGVPQIPGVSNKQYPIKIKWKSPEFIPRVAQCAEGSGDCEGLLEEPRDAHPTRLEGSSELTKASEEVRRALSLRFQRHSEVCYYVQEDYLSKTRRHDYDLESPAAVIAQLTVRIRNHQKELMRIAPKLNQARKHSLKILIDVRHHYLKKLRESDYKQFEWLLEKLNLVYKERAPYEVIRRSEKCELLTDLWCKEFRWYKLMKYQLEMEKEQPKFLREKAETLKWIMKEEAALGVEPTVSQADVDACKQKADEIDKKLYEKGFDVDVSQFRIFEVKVEEEEKLRV